MTERVLGPKESPRRRWTMLLALMAVLAVGLMYVAGAQAVHDDGNIALEGNATTGNECTTDANTTPAGCDPHNPLGITTGEDWDRVFAGTDTADDGGFVTDTTLSGGLQGQGDTILPDNTKDIQAISGPNSWAWKQTGTTSVQDKADLEHAYAAQYDDELYFGADRASNSGDTVMGFWFFREEIGKFGPDANGNGTFTGNHVARGQLGAGERGDILIVSDFRQGGKAPQIQVYEWVTSGGSAATNLDLIAGSDTNPPTPRSCTQAPGEKNNDPPVPPVNNGDPLCATANQFIVTAPWKYDAKSNSGGTSGDNGTGKFGVATLMEGGVDLAAFGFGDTCFSSFMAETRSSHSVTSTLSDFVLGGFGACTSSLTTTPKNDTGGALTPDSDSDNLVEIPIGTNGQVQVTDSAQLTVNGVNSFTGTLAFYICGPFDNPNACTTSGVSVAAAAGVNPVTANGTYSSVAVTLTSVGRYCWYAFFDSGTNGVPDAPDGTIESAGSTGECFEVMPRAPTLTTQASNGTLGTAAVFGTAINDLATLSGTARQPKTGGPNATYPTIHTTPPVAPNLGALAVGTITFKLYGPAETATCTDPATGVTGNLIATSVVNVSGDSVVGPPATYYASTGTITGNGGTLIPPSPGHYWWRASYSGNSPNTLPAPKDSSNAATFTACGETGEDSFVQQIPSTIQTAQWIYPNDDATVAVTAGGDIEGSLQFRLFNTSASCLANTTTGVGNGGLLYEQTVPIADDTDDVSGADSETKSTSNIGTKVTSSTTVYWRVLFTSTNQAHENRLSNCTENTLVTFTGNNTGTGVKP